MIHGCISDLGRNGGRRTYYGDFGFKDTPVRMIGNFISLFSLLLTLVIMSNFKKKIR
jgi:hypothetical protein